MKSNLFTTAIKDGKYISINEFQSGIGADCRCICPHCGEKVRSNVTNKRQEELKIKYTNHFSHINEDSKCMGGYKETDIHLFAKEVLEKSKFVFIPAGNSRVKLEYNKVVIEPSFPIEKFKWYRPDIILYCTNGEKMAIEIIVSNPVSDDKAQLYRDCELKSFAIDLSSYHKLDLETFKEDLTNDILTGIRKKKWIWEGKDIIPVREPEPILNSNKWWENPFLWLFAIIITLIMLPKKN